MQGNSHQLFFCTKFAKLNHNGLTKGRACYTSTTILAQKKIKEQFLSAVLRDHNWTQWVQNKFWRNDEGFHKPCSISMQNWIWVKNLVPSQQVPPKEMYLERSHCSSLLVLVVYKPNLDRSSPSALSSWFVLLCPWLLVNKCDDENCNLHKF